MANKKKKAKTSKTVKKGARVTTSKKPVKASAKPAKKTAAKKKAKPPKEIARPVAPNKPKKKTPKKPATTKAAVASPKTFAEKVRDGDQATAVWFITAGNIEHAAIEKRGNDGTVVILTDAGVTEVTPASNLFETADEARAARY